MKPEDFDPKTFFAFHDLNGDGVWDQDEVKVCGTAHNLYMLIDQNQLKECRSVAMRLCSATLTSWNNHYISSACRCCLRKN